MRTLLGVCFVFGTAGWVSAASTSTQHSPSSSAGFNSNFAIADFDGDRKPDLATVEIQKGSSASRTQYSIRLQLTLGATQVFGVTAPAGGLQIVAKDVNGDDALDVVVSTALQHEQVAVLLNDGHGKFTLADPSAFPDLMRNSQADWSGATTQICDNAAIPSSWSSAKVSGVCAGAFLTGNDAELTPLSDFRLHAVQPVFGCSGRAPPFAVLHV
ncbi:MAG TPA: VCBS repeat-containing protein [Candidatus Binatus sp.]|nr:VCBS repeat-containing protein [Candidatus Binatus sp.]